MKKPLFTGIKCHWGLIIFLVVSKEIDAQNDSINHADKPNIINVNIANAVFGGIELNYERHIINSKINFSTSIALNKFTFFFPPSRKTFEVNEELRYYPVMTGFHIGPFIQYTKGQYFRYSFFSPEDPLVIADGSTLAYGMIIGYQWLVFEHFVIDDLIGIGWERLLTEKVTYQKSGFTSGISDIIGKTFHFGFLIGFKF